MRSLLLFGCLCGMVFTSPTRRVAPRGERPAMRVNPASAKIGIFYAGVQLTVTCPMDTGTDAAVLVSGPPADLHLRKQARTWGIFWAPAGEVSFEALPSVYLLRTSVAVEELAPAAVRSTLGIGYESFRPTGTGNGQDLFADLIRLKEAEGVFHYAVGGLQVDSAAEGRQVVKAVIDVPPRARAAVYRVQCFGFDRHAVTMREEGTFTLTRGVFYAFVGALAQQHGLLYGILAVVVAVGAGLLVGMVFGSVKGH